MLHLYYFESLKQHGNLNENYHKSELDAMINLMLDNCFEILGW